MAVSVALSSSLNTGTGSSQSTGAVGTTSGKTQLLVIACFPGTGDSGQPTVAGWALVRSYNYNAGDGERTLNVFRRWGTGSTITSTIAFANSQDEFQWHWLELTGANETSGDGASAIVQTAVNLGNSTSQLATLAAFENAANATLGLVGAAGGAGALTVGSGFTQLAQTSGTVQGDDLLTQFKATNDTTVDSTSAGADFWGVIGIELRDSSVPAPTLSATLGQFDPELRLLAWF